MPELPEVETVARDLRPRIVDSTIAGATVLWPRTWAGDPATVSEALAGRRIESVGRRGKFVLIGLSGDAALTIHLKMTGQLFVVDRAVSLDPYVRFVMELDDGRDLRFRDIRKFGRVAFHIREPRTGELVRAEVGTASFAGLGPEPLEPEFTLRRFRSRLRARRGRLKSLLLDQSFIAGVGNIYADEALWTARLHPLRRTTSLRPADERHLYSAIRTILAEAVERRGSSIDDYTAPDGDGSMQEQLLVYQRAGEDCPRCGRPIRRIVVGGRATHFCSWCQRLPSRDRPGTAAILRTARRLERTGGRWTTLTGSADGAVPVGLSPDEAAAARSASRAASRARAERTRGAAAARRAAARRSAG
jgi:formamidopyrimidine-DNA glycosylase